MACNLYMTGSNDTPTPTLKTSSPESPPEVPFSEQPLHALLGQTTREMPTEALQAFVTELQRHRVPATLRASVVRGSAHEPPVTTAATKAALDAL